ncbi:Protoporphyrin IX Mg-chelatase subunit D [Roseibacterium elongatum DSM 19469]|uniref:Mg-protoporphyrin IX chelatase n=1 Tax=Roseicyclus elongatus DSM 19469 TaxID=1294273 RepID=W8SLV4_9RHOB|nr:magnesium chelatase subunit D [Roseibacterium elongatum]AHM03510.1 Protoporphyrin IX Mg-chelatase subunit D [Roseibacterium elongatum DSM 19469]
MSTGEERWQRANLALACFALCPSAMGGIWLRARVGPVRDRFLAGLDLALRGHQVRRLHPNIGDDALFGGVDLAATLDSGTLTRTRGLLETPGMLVLPMAERAKPGLAARLAGALDADRGLSLVALDEGASPDETLAPALADRLAIHLDLGDQRLSDAPDLAIDTDALVEARRLLPKVTVPDTAVSELAEVAMRLGVLSLRAPLQALAVARASAALSGETEVDEPDLITAIELVLAPRATQFPEAPPEEAEAPEDQPEPEAPDDTAEDESDEDDTPPLPTEILLEAAKAMLPPDLLARLEAGRAARNAPGASGSGASKKGNRRGRPMPSRAGRMGGEARVDLVSTLRAAAPWQPLRRRATGIDDRIHVRMSDIRIRQFEEKSDRAIIFVVDASGSSALARLAETKGAIELLLAEAYSRRDHVALVAFRGDGAEVLLPPTRSLVQTKRRLAQLPGGGGTPLASGLKSALDLADLARSKGLTPSVALLTDGRANVDLSGTADRVKAAEDATLMARALRSRGMPGLVIDTGLRPTRGLDGLAREMGVPYLPLPRADAQAVSAAVETALDPA